MSLVSRTIAGSIVIGGFAFSLLDETGSVNMGAIKIALLGGAGTTFVSALMGTPIAFDLPTLKLFVINVLSNGASAWIVLTARQLPLAQDRLPDLPG